MTARFGQMACALLLACTMAAAAGFWESLDQAMRLQHEGRFEDAIAAYQQAQIERPEAEIVHYGLGSAYYQQGAALEPTADSDHENSMAKAAAITAFQHAAASFDKLENATDADLRREAAYGAASARARAARLADPAAGQNPARELRSAIESLETFLEQYPEHEAARHTLDATRYSLKTLLQEPPPEQPQQQSGDENEDEGEEGQQEQEQESSQGEQAGDEQEQQESQDGEAPEDGSQPEASPDEPQEDREPEGEQPQPSPPEEEQGEQQEEDASASAGQPEEEQEQPESQEAAGGQEERKDMPNIEAILQSLEDMDRREQQDMRTGAGGPEVRGAWW